MALTEPTQPLFIIYRLEFNTQVVHQRSQPPYAHMPPRLTARSDKNSHLKVSRRCFLWVRPELLKIRTGPLSDSGEI